MGKGTGCNMKYAYKFICLISAVLVLVCVSSVFAQDWSQWRGVNRDGKITKFSAPKTWPTVFTQRWKTVVGLGDAAPVLVGQKLYVFTRQGDNEVALCLDAATGKELWKTEYAAQAITGPPSSHPGPRSTPAVVSGKVITLGVGGVLSCLQAATGKLIWRKNDFPQSIPEFGTAMSPIIVDMMVIAHLGSKSNGAVVAYNLADGSVKWKCSGESPTYSSPVLMNVAGVKQLVIFTDKSLEGIGTKDGKILW